MSESPLSLTPEAAPSVCGTADSRRESEYMKLRSMCDCHRKAVAATSRGVPSQTAAPFQPVEQISSVLNLLRWAKDDHCQRLLQINVFHPSPKKICFSLLHSFNGLSFFCDFVRVLSLCCHWLKLGTGSQ